MRTTKTHEVSTSSASTASSFNNKDLYFQGQYPNETVLTFFRHHWILALPHFLVILFLIVFFMSILITLPAFATGQNFTNYFQTIITGLILFIGLLIHVFFVAGIKHFLNIVIITNLRIIEVKKSLFLKDSQDSLSFMDIQDMKRDQNSFWKNMLGYGDLLIMLPASERILSHVPNPNYHFRLINMAKENYNKTSQKQQHTTNPKIIP
jgi:hypothetical protein